MFIEMDGHDFFGFLMLLFLGVCQGFLFFSFLLENSVVCYTHAFHDFYICNDTYSSALFETNFNTMGLNSNCADM